jgi:predicted nucleic acid-binding protein
MNLVDSCGWLEHFQGGSNQAFFAPILQDSAQLLVASLSIYEVCRRVLVLYGSERGSADEGSQRAHLIYRAMSQLPVVQLDAAGMYQAALAAQQHKLHLADAIIWQTAQQHGATLYTQDAALEGLPGVVYQAKPQGAVQDLSL